MREYDIDLMALNDDLYHAYVESHTGTGGERRVVFLRQHEKGIPITLRENYSDGRSSVAGYHLDQEDLRP